MYKFLDKQYFSIEDVEKEIVGNDKDSRLLRSQIYSNYEKRICEMVNLFEESKLIEDSISGDVFLIECLRVMCNDDIVFMYEGHVIYLIRKIRNVFFIFGSKEGQMKELHTFPKFKTAAHWCICRMMSRDFLEYK